MGAFYALNPRIARAEEGTCARCCEQSSDLRFVSMWGAIDGAHFRGHGRWCPHCVADLRLPESGRPIAADGPEEWEH